MDSLFLKSEKPKNNILYLDDNVYGELVCFYTHNSQQTPPTILSLVFKNVFVLALLKTVLLYFLFLENCGVLKSKSTLSLVQISYMKPLILNLQLSVTSWSFGKRFKGLMFTSVRAQLQGTEPSTDVALLVKPTRAAKPFGSTYTIWNYKRNTVKVHIYNAVWKIIVFFFFFLKVWRCLKFTSILLKILSKKNVFCLPWTRNHQEQYGFLLSINIHFNDKVYSFLENHKCICLSSLMSISKLVCL